MTSGWLLTAIEAAEIVGCSAGLIRAHANQGKIATVRQGRLMFFSLEDVQRVRDERRRLDALLTTEGVAKMLHVTENFITGEVRAGRLRLEAQVAYNAYRFEPSDVADYWREHMDCVCVRCGILGEATAARTYRCAACEYEERTGRIYRWPGASCLKAVRHGALQLSGCGRGG